MSSASLELYFVDLLIRVHRNSKLISSNLLSPLGAQSEHFSAALQTLLTGVSIQFSILFKLNSVRSGCPISRARGSCIKCSSIPDRIGIWKCWFLRRGENRSTRRKTSRSREENQQQTQPTYDVESENRTRSTLVEGDCSHHCAIPAPQKVVFSSSNAQS